MEGIKCFKPYDEIDKKFGEYLRYADKEGVKILAYDCFLGENFIILKDEIKVCL